MDKTDRMAEIVDATVTVLSRKGFDDLTLADVAEEAGISTALIIVHFTSKDNLLSDVIEVLGEAYFAALTASQIASDPPQTRLLKLVEAEFDPTVFTERQLGAWKAIWSETNARKPFLARFSDETRNVTNLMIELCRQIAETEPSPIKADIKARILDVALGGIWIELTSGPTPLDLDGARAMANALLALVFPNHFGPDGALERVA